ncbi:MAG: 3-deoxy-8-phosphooctulonate synthase [Fibromonadaceae bacterium]|jgi:2-dehydro-3-deoxyphosphooctonate aldolase (KDO 8-P synthase)|nr:3-deoxy-8-phosphooctulonate synthase [Fibromonadaceae bacterium]
MSKFIVIAGPCVIEDESLVLSTAEHLLGVVDKFNLDFTFKASFDKANRTSLTSYRGPGIDKGLEILSKVKHTLGVKIATDIHEPWQAGQVAEVADIIQIPAFLCRQSDLLIAAAKTGKTINVKKAQFLAPWDMKNVVEKIEKSGNKNILLCERGTFFGYNSLVVDITSIPEMQKIGYPTLFDATHSVQKPGGNGTSTGGNREYIKPLALAATAAGADGLFFETHPSPDKALSDGANSIPLSDAKKLLSLVMRTYEAVHNE